MPEEEKISTNNDGREKLVSDILQIIKENSQTQNHLMKFEMDIDDENVPLLEALIQAIIELKPEKVEIFVHVPQNNLTEKKYISMMYL